jgi:hypothetical protein
MMFLDPNKKGKDFKEQSDLAKAYDEQSEKLKNLQSQIDKANKSTTDFTKSSAFEINELNLTIGDLVNPFAALANNTQRFTQAFKGETILNDVKFLVDNSQKLANNMGIGSARSGELRAMIANTIPEMVKLGISESDSLKVEHQFMWPATLKLVLSNKNLSSDTKLDNNGKIVADKFIELTKIYIDGVDANIEFMQRIVLNTNKEKIKTCYWGFNGTVEIAFDLIDSFAWHLRQRVKQNKVDVYVQQIKKI